MPKSKSTKTPNKPLTASTIDLNPKSDNYKHAWITDRAWVSGLIGVIAILACATWYAEASVLTEGVRIGGWHITNNRNDSILFVLVVVAIVLLISEFIRIHFFMSENHRFGIHTKLKKGKYLGFAFESLLHYLAYLALLKAVVLFFHTAGEYGYQRNAAYYQVWFRFLEWVWIGYLWGGYPYVMLTRGLKEDKAADQFDLAAMLIRWSKNLKQVAFGNKKRFPFVSKDKKNLRSLIVKLFFAPLMTVFFIDQFPHLVANIHYVFHGLPGEISNGRYSHFRFNQDFFNVSVAFIFSIDVALAWCGYVTSSRWVDNQTLSVEPTMLGWVVCLICYPPFQMFLGLYYGAPNERDIFNIQIPWLVTIFSTMMLLSYFIYMWTTLTFGVRFSNLTHRGIIRSGPFKYIRHPAYASKNFAWWCIMFPSIIYNMTHNGFAIAITQTLGLVLMTWVYYWRAITEEKHLLADRQYREYCDHVKYRFIPKVF